jgi:hypothetical protein
LAANSTSSTTPAGRDQAADLIVPGAMILLDL